MQLQPRTPAIKKNKNSNGSNPKSTSHENRMISGLVTNVVDGNTFDLKVNGNLNSDDAVIQRIRIAGNNKPDVTTLPGILAKLDLEKRMTGRKICCKVIGKDSDHHPVVEISPQDTTSRFTLNLD